MGDNLEKRDERKSQSNSDIPKSPQESGRRIIKDDTFNESEAIKNSGERYSEKLEAYLTQSTKKNQRSLLKETLYIRREGTVFEIPLKEVLIFNIPLFRCKRCGNIWGVQNKNAPLKFPLRCSRCNVRYWFVTKEEMKKLGLLKKNVIYSLNKSKLKVIDFEPKRKYKVKKEENEEW